MAKPLLVEIFGDASQYQRTLDKAAGRTQRFGAAAKIAGGLLVTGLAVGLEQSVKAAVHAESSQARLTQAFKDAHIAMGPLKDSIDKVEAAGRKLGFTDEQQKQALGSLIVSTGNYDQSVRQMAIAMDLARFKGVGLEQATKALTMAHAGSLRPLKQLGIDIPKVTAAQDALKASTDNHTGAAYRNALAQAKLEDKQATFARVLDVVTGKVRGQSKAYSETAAGSMAQFNAQVEHLKVTLGTKLLPAIVAVTQKLNQFIEIMQKIPGSDKSGLQLLTEGFHKLTAAVGSPMVPLRGIINLMKSLASWAGAAAAAVERLIGALGRIHVPSIHIPKVHIPGLASGGTITGAGIVRVGERGPENLFLPGGATVAPLSRGGGGGMMQVNLNLDGRTIASMLVDPLRNEVRQLQRRGGRF